MGKDPFTGPTLFGVVEVGRTLIGGRRHGVGKGNRTGKVWIAGAIQRDGQIWLEHIPNVRRKTLQNFISRTVKDEVEAIYSDDLKSYLALITTTRAMKR